MRDTYHETTAFIGQRIRQARALTGLTQRDLAGAIGCTCQQIQKYENGKNRVASGLLFVMAREMGTTTDFFYPVKGNAVENFNVPTKTLLRYVTLLDKKNIQFLTRLAKDMVATEKRP